eukprot:13090110-Alexandrium_andersonii.AAC.1
MAVALFAHVAHAKLDMRPAAPNDNTCFCSSKHTICENQVSPSFREVASKAYARARAERRQHQCRTAVLAAAAAMPDS